MADPDPRDSLTWARIVAYIVFIPLVFGVILFLPAGTFDWPAGWVFFVVFLVLMLVSSVVLWRVNPAIYKARERIQPGTKPWDRIIASTLIVAFMAVPVAGALETARFGNPAMPMLVIVLGYILLLAGFWLMGWAQAENRFFEPGVRIQSDRGHKVIDSGPYAYVRHPGYSGAFALFIGMALVLGSWWTLALALATCVLLVVRTLWEEETLRAELPGYADYAARVQARYVPGLW